MEEIHILGKKNQKIRADKTAVVKSIKDYNAEEKSGLFQVIPRPKLEPNGRKLQKLSLGRSSVEKKKTLYQLLEPLKNTLPFEAFISLSLAIWR